jgi:hypothetical protein
LNIAFQPGKLTPHELQTTSRLIREQYANPTWTASR